MGEFALLANVSREMGHSLKQLVDRMGRICAVRRTPAHLALAARREAGPRGGGASAARREEGVVGEGACAPCAPARLAPLADLCTRGPAVQQDLGAAARGPSTGSSLVGPGGGGGQCAERPALKGASHRPRGKPGWVLQVAPGWLGPRGGCGQCARRLALGVAASHAAGEWSQLRRGVARGPRHVWGAPGPWALDRPPRPACGRPGSPHEPPKATPTQVGALEGSRKIGVGETEMGRGRPCQGAVLRLRLLLDQRPAPGPRPFRP